MRDITSREDILSIITSFYDALLQDTLLAPFFTIHTGVELHLEEHKELLATFWEQVLFLKGGYYNNMFAIHQNLHAKIPFQPQHYERWLLLFYIAIDNRFEGIMASKMKNEAKQMSIVMQLKLK